MSKRIQTVYEVSCELKAAILEDLDNGAERTLDDIEALTSSAFKKMAEKTGRTEGTVRAACTRDIKMSTEEFYNSLKGLISRKDETLIYRMCAHMTAEDSEWEIERLMKGLFRGE